MARPGSSRPGTARRSRSRSNDASALFCRTCGRGRTFPAPDRRLPRWRRLSSSGLLGRSRREGSLLLCALRGLCRREGRRRLRALKVGPVRHPVGPLLRSRLRGDASSETRRCGIVLAVAPADLVVIRVNVVLAHASTFPWAGSSSAATRSACTATRRPPRSFPRETRDLRRTGRAHSSRVRAVRGRPLPESRRS